MPTLPRLWMWPGMMPILHSPGVMMPGQFGPIRRVLEPVSARFTFTMSSTGMPFGDADDQIRDFGVDRLEDRIGREGRRHVDHGRIAPVFAFAPLATVSNTGRPRCFCRPCPA
jgi:hypothetical protein